jgi:hypothetical protein
MKARVDLVLDCANPQQLVQFWREALRYREYFVDTSLAVLVPKDNHSPPLVLQGVPEPKTGKNRMHLDSSWITCGDLPRAHPGTGPMDPTESSSRSEPRVSRWFR